MIEGVVSDGQTGDQLAGVTVIVTSRHLSAPITQATDEHGHYRLENLPAPGVYLVTFYYGDVVIEREIVADAARPIIASPVMRSAADGVVRWSCEGPVAQDRSICFMWEARRIHLQDDGTFIVLPHR